MHAPASRWMAYKRTAARNLALGALVAALVATTALPAFAGTPDRGRQESAHEQNHGRAASAAQKGKRTRNKTVTRAFSNGDAIVIPNDASGFGVAFPYPSSVSVNGFKKAKIADVNLTLNGLSHTFPADIQVMLVAPGGRNAVVMAEVGRDDVETNVEDITLTFDDEAAEALPLDNALTDGAFRPLANEELFSLDFPAPAPVPSGGVALSTFDGGNPNGDWQIFIIDSGLGDSGRLDRGWQLEITAKAKVKGKGKKKR